jgi:O-antigen ligase
MKQLLLLDAASGGFTKKEKILYFLILFFFLTLYNPFWTVLNNISLWLIFLYSFFVNPFSQKIQLLKQRKEVMLLLLFFLFNVASAFFSANIKAGISWTGIRIALFALPLAFGTIYIRPLVKERIIYGFASSTALAALGCLLWGFYRFIHLHDAALLYNDSLTDIIHLQSIYFAMLVNLALFSYAWLWMKNSPLLNKNIAVLVIFLLLVVHFLLASRAAIFILYGSIAVFAMVYIIRHRKILEGATLIMGLAIGSFLLVRFFPKTINRFKELTYTHFNYTSNGPESHYNMAVTPDQWNGANIRIAVWECGWKVIQQHPWLGVGVGDKTDAMQQQYAAKGFEFGIKTNRNMHNNYLDVWQSMGLAGLCLFLAAFLIYPLQKCIKARDWWGMMMMIAFTLSMLSETYMDRTVGNELLGFFFGFMTAYKTRYLAPV